MRIELDFEKSVEENASLQFENAKKFAKKLHGLGTAIENMKKKVALSEIEKKQVQGPVKKKKIQWFSRFHWFFSSDKFLVVGGRSAKDNEQLVKKQLGEKDFFVHADIQGGSACIVKAEGKEVSSKALSEAAQFAAVFCKAWKQGLSSVDVYAVSKKQVSKSAPSGTALPTGSFMIYGKRKWFRKTALKLFIGVNVSGELVSGPAASVKAVAKKFVEIHFGKENQASAAKKVVSALGKDNGVKIDLDGVIRMLPADGIEVKVV